MIILSIGHSETGGGAQTVYKISNSVGDEDIQIYTAFESTIDNKADINLSTYKSYKHIKKIICYFHNRKNVRTLKRFLTENEINIIHIHNTTLLGLSTLLVLNKYKKKSKIILTSHGFGLTCANYSNYNYAKEQVCNICAMNSDYNTIINKCDKRGRLFSIIRFLDFKLKKLVSKKYKIFDAIIVPSRYLKKSLEESKYEFKKIEVISNPIQNFLGNGIIKWDGTFTFTYIGRFSEEKNVELLLKAFALLLKNHTNIKLKLIGDGKLKEVYLNIIKNLHIEEYVYVSGGFIPQHLLGRVLSDSNFVVLPTKSPETFGLAIFDGLIFNNIPIVANIGAQKENVEKIGIGYVFENNNEYSLMENMSSAINNYTNDQLELSNRIEEIYNEYSIQKYKENLIAFYNKIYTQ